MHAQELMTVHLDLDLDLQPGSMAARPAAKHRHVSILMDVKLPSVCMCVPHFAHCFLFVG